MSYIYNMLHNVLVKQGAANAAARYGLGTLDSSVIEKLGAVDPLKGYYLLKSRIGRDIPDAFRLPGANQRPWTPYSIISPKDEYLGHYLMDTGFPGHINEHLIELLPQGRGRRIPGRVYETAFNDQGGKILLSDEYLTPGSRAQWERMRMDPRFDVDTSPLSYRHPRTGKPLGRMPPDAAELQAAQWSDPQMPHWMQESQIIPGTADQLDETTRWADLWRDYQKAHTPEGMAPDLAGPHPWLYRLKGIEPGELPHLPVRSTAEEWRHLRPDSFKPYDVVNYEKLRMNPETDPKLLEQPRWDRLKQLYGQAEPHGSRKLEQLRASIPD